MALIFYRFNTYESEGSILPYVGEYTINGKGNPLTYHMEGWNCLRREKLSRQPYSWEFVAKNIHNKKGLCSMLNDGFYGNYSVVNVADVISKIQEQMTCFLNSIGTDPQMKEYINTLGGDSYNAAKFYADTLYYFGSHRTNSAARIYVPESLLILSEYKKNNFKIINKKSNYGDLDSFDSVVKKMTNISDVWRRTVGSVELNLWYRVTPKRIADLIGDSVDKEAQNIIEYVKSASDKNKNGNYVNIKLTVNGTTTDAAKIRTSITNLLNKNGIINKKFYNSLKKQLEKEELAVKQEIKATENTDNRLMRDAHDVAQTKLKLIQKAKKALNALIGEMDKKNDYQLTKDVINEISRIEKSIKPSCASLKENVGGRLKAFCALYKQFLYSQELVNISSVFDAHKNTSDMAVFLNKYKEKFSNWYHTNILDKILTFNREYSELRYVSMFGSDEDADGSAAKMKLIEQFGEITPFYLRMDHSTPYIRFLGSRMIYAQVEKQLLDSNVPEFVKSYNKYRIYGEQLALWFEANHFSLYNQNKYTSKYRSATWYTTSNISQMTAY